jgi:hypothetical protein
MEIANVLMASRTVRRLQPVHACMGNSRFLVDLGHFTTDASRQQR